MKRECLTMDALEEDACAVVPAPAFTAECPNATRPSVRVDGEPMAGMGHEERFPPTRLSAGCGFIKETIAGMRRNGRDAPKAAILPSPNRYGGPLAAVGHSRLV
jgi:hypothetical protein